MERKWDESCIPIKLSVTLTVVVSGRKWRLENAISVLYMEGDECLATIAQKELHCSQNPRLCANVVNQETQMCNPRLHLGPSTQMTKSLLL